MSYYNVSVNGVVVKYTTAITLKTDLSAQAFLIKNGYWKAVETGEYFTFIAIIY